MADNEKIRLGHDARQLLESDVFKNVISGLERGFFKQWIATEPKDEQARADIYYTTVALGFIKTTLQAMADEGRIEQEKLNREGGEESQIPA